MILDAATAVISQNRNRKPKRLWTDRQGGSKITYFRGVDDLDEAALHHTGRARRALARTSNPWSRCSTARTPSRASLKTR